MPRGKHRGVLWVWGRPIAIHSLDLTTDRDAGADIDVENGRNEEARTIQTIRKSNWACKGNSHEGQKSDECELHDGGCGFS